MRTLLTASACTLGSVAFQMSVDAGWFRNSKWAIPWAWALSVSLWLFLIISWAPIREKWLRKFHDSVGKAIHPIRFGLCLIVFLIVGFGLKFSMVDSSRNKNSSGSLGAQASPQQSSTAASLAPQTISGQQKSKPKPATQVQRSTGQNSTNTQIDTAQGPVAIAPSGIANTAPNLGSQTVNNNIISPAPTGNLASRCEDIGKDIALYVDGRSKIQPEKKQENLHDYNDWIKANDAMFRARGIEKKVKDLHADLLGRYDKDPQLDELLKRSDEVWQFRNGDRGMQSCPGNPQGWECYLSLEEIKEIGERFISLSTQKL
jgi:hypothetical protein